MATNRIQEDSDVLTIAKASVSSGDPVLEGEALIGVSLIDTDADGNISVQTRGVFDLNCEAVDNVPALDAIVIGDVLYYDSAPAVKINKDTVNGVRFGIALEALATGTGIIKVMVGY